MGVTVDRACRTFSLSNPSEAGRGLATVLEVVEVIFRQTADFLPSQLVVKITEEIARGPDRE